MQMLRRLVGFLVFMVVLGQGLMLLNAGLSTDRWHVFAVLIKQGRLSGLCAGLALTCLAVLLALTSLSRRKRPKFLSLDTENGTVSISADAIAEYIAKLAEEFPSVVRMRPMVIPARNAVDIRVQVDMKAGPQIHEACELLQRRVRESMTDGLGISQIRNIEVSVKEIHSEHIRS